MATNTQLLHLLFLLAGAAIIADAASKGKLPSYLKKCSVKDPAYKDCLKRNANLALPRIAQGDASIKIPKLDPLTIPELRVSQGSPPNHLDMVSRNLEVSGLSSSDVLEAEAPLKDKYFNVKVFIPRAEILSDYEIEGQVIVLPVRGKGRANITLENINMDLKMMFKINVQNGQHFAQITDHVAKFNCSRAHFHFSNLFDGDKTLGDGVNSYLNDNWQIVLEELGQPFVDTTADVVSAFSTAFCNIFPLDEIFDDYDSIKNTI